MPCEGLKSKNQYFTRITLDFAYRSLQEMPCSYWLWLYLRLQSLDYNLLVVGTLLYALKQDSHNFDFSKQRIGSVMDKSKLKSNSEIKEPNQK